MITRCLNVTVATLCAWIAIATSAAAQTTVNVDANANRHSISPLVYGVNWPNAADYAALNLPIARAGGENQDEYDWQVNENCHDAAQDWYWESFQDAGGNTANGAQYAFINGGLATNTLPMIEVPMLPYIAKVGSGGASLRAFSVAKYGAQTAVDPYNSDAGNGVSKATGQNITGNNPLDAYVANSTSIQSGMVNDLISKYGNSSSGGVKYYIMDNEPAIWSTVHRDIHPQAESYDELYNLYLNYAGAIRAADPNALIVGPEEWGWAGYFFSGVGSSDYSSHGNMYAMPWLLQQLHNYQVSTGKQLLNVFSLHFYPQDGSANDDDSAGQDAIRNQSTRSLWDPNYVDQSWIPSMGINGGKVQLIPMMQNWVNTYYPGLPTAITEYNWGDEEHMNGADAQADVLGIFGRQNLTIGTRWVVPVSTTPTYLVFELYRNYDGNDSMFGDTSCSDTVANPDNLSSFSAVRSSDGAMTVMVINKQTASTAVTINLANFTAGSSAQVWQISSETQTAITHAANVNVAGNAISTTVPSQSITLFVIPAGTVSQAATHFSVSAPSGASAGTRFNVTVTALTASNTTATGYLGTVHFTSTSAGTLPANATLTNGVRTFAVTLKTLGNQSVTATDTVTASITGTSGNILVAVGPASHLVLSAPAHVVAGTPFSLTVTAKDAANNTVTGYPGTVHFTSTSAGTLPANSTLTNGVGTFSATLTTAGNETITGTDTVTGSITGKTMAIAVAPVGTVPGVPGTPKATAGNAQVGLMWTAALYAATYNVKRSTVSGGPYTDIATGVAKGSYTDKTAANGTTYYYVVSGVDTGGEGPNSGQVAATPVLPVPKAPTNLKATAGTGLVTLTWSAPTNVMPVTYNVGRATTLGGPYTNIVTGKTGTGYKDMAVVSGTTYFYVVTATNTAGTSPNSGEANAKPN